MSRVETTSQTAVRFIPSWQHQDPRRQIAELLSMSKETHRQSDSYHFETANGVLIDPETKKPIKSFIEQESYLGGIEYQILEQLESWSNEAEDGVAYWISAPFPDIYPCSKAIIHQIAYTLSGEKVILNTAIVFDANIPNPEELRRTLFTSQDSNQTIESLLTWIEMISGQSIAISEDNDAHKQAEYFADKITAGHSPESIVREMETSGFLGKNPISCPASMGQPTTFLGFLTPRTTEIRTTKWEYHIGTCRVCSKEDIEVGPCSICKDCEQEFN